jgi:hypothetical protein
MSVYVRGTMDIEIVKVIARYRNGKLVKGFTRNFFPTKDRIHISPPHDPYGEGTGIWLQDLKALFFVRDFAGNPHYNESKVIVEEAKLSGRPVEITFSDGEVLVGSTFGYAPDRPGFFVSPADSKSNNKKIFALSSAVEKVRRM